MLQTAEEVIAYVFGPALAIESRPGLVCLILKFSSGNLSPQIDFPPVPLFRVRIVREVIERRVKETYIATSEVTPLKHELGDHTVEFRARVSETLLASTKGTKVVCRLGDNIIIELEVDAARLVYIASQ